MRLAGDAHPSTIAFNVLYDAQSLQLISVAEGATLQNNQQLFLPEPTLGSVPITAFGGVGTAINDGELAVVTFRVLSGASKAVTLSFGQASAASVLGTGLPVFVTSGEVFINCDGVGPDVPADVTASQGDPNGVTVEWAPVDGNVEYRVYRARTNNAENAVAVSAWLADSTSFLDTSALAPEGALIMGCQGQNVDTTVHYYYWVRAREEGGCPSDYSQPAEGWRGAAAKADANARADAGLLAGMIVLMAAAGAVARRYTGGASR